MRSLNYAALRWEPSHRQQCSRRLRNDKRSWNLNWELWISESRFEISNLKSPSPLLDSQLPQSLVLALAQRLGLGLERVPANRVVQFLPKLLEAHEHEPE